MNAPPLIGTRLQPGVSDLSNVLAVLTDSGPAGETVETGCLNNR